MNRWKGQNNYMIFMALQWTGSRLILVATKPFHLNRREFITPKFFWNMLAGKTQILFREMAKTTNWFLFRDIVLQFSSVIWPPNFSRQTKIYHLEHWYHSVAHKKVKHMNHEAFRHVTNTRKACDQHEEGMWPTRGRHVTNTRKACNQHEEGM